MMPSTRRVRCTAAVAPSRPPRRAAQGARAHHHCLLPHGTAPGHSGPVERRPGHLAAPARAVQSGPSWGQRVAARQRAVRVFAPPLPADVPVSQDPSPWGVSRRCSRRPVPRRAYCSIAPPRAGCPSPSTARRPAAPGRRPRRPRPPAGWPGARHAGALCPPPGAPAGGAAPAGGGLPAVPSAPSAGAPQRRSSVGPPRGPAQPHPAPVRRLPRGRPRPRTRAPRVAHRRCDAARTARRHARRDGPASAPPAHALGDGVERETRWPRPATAHGQWHTGATPRGTLHWPSRWGRCRPMRGPDAPPHQVGPITCCSPWPTSWSVSDRRAPVWSGAEVRESPYT